MFISPGSWTGVAFHILYKVESGRSAHQQLWTHHDDGSSAGAVAGADGPAAAGGDLDVGPTQPGTPPGVGGAGSRAACAPARQAISVTMQGGGPSQLSSVRPRLSSSMRGASAGTSKGFAARLSAVSCSDQPACVYWSWKAQHYNNP